MKCDLDYDERMSHTSVIREHYMFLLETLDSKISGGLVGQLYSDQILTAVERDDIVAEKTSFGANEKLLSVLSRKSPQQFQLFLDALDNCGQQHVRNVIAHRQGLTRLSMRLSSDYRKILFFRFKNIAHVHYLEQQRKSLAGLISQHTKRHSRSSGLPLSATLYIFLGATSIWHHSRYIAN